MGRLACVGHRRFVVATRSLKLVGAITFKVGGPLSTAVYSVRIGRRGQLGVLTAAHDAAMDASATTSVPVTAVVFLEAPLG